MNDGDAYVTACHEAGHVNACELRGVKVGRVYINTYDGRTDFETSGCVDYAFIVYAGPWAEARAGWTEPTIDDAVLDATGRSFAAHVAAAFSFNTSDWVEYEQEMGGDFSAVSNAGLAEMFGWEFEWPRMTPPEPTWPAELEARWPEIQELATRMLACDRVLQVGTNEPLVRQP